MKLKQLLIVIMLLPLFAFSQKEVYRQVAAARSNGNQFRELSVFRFISSDLKTEKVDPEVLKEGILLLQIGRAYV